MCADANISHLDRAKSVLCTLMTRDFLSDVRDLNVQLAMDGRNAGFVSEPPMPFSGNPFNLEIGNCIALLGINPRFQTDARSAVEYPLMRKLAKEIRDGVSGAVERYIEFRGSYFDANSKIYYGRYFSRIGNILKRPLALEESTPTRQVFQKHVLKTDCLAWLSPNISKIDFRRVETAENEGIRIHHQLVKSLLAAKKPKWIQINGLSTSKTFEKFFDLTFSEVWLDSEHVRYLHAEVKVDELKIPVVVHPFANRLSTATAERLLSSFLKRYEIR